MSMSRVAGLRHKQRSSLLIISVTNNIFAVAMSAVHFIAFQGQNHLFLGG